MSLPLHVHRWGQGPRVVLVHGGILGGRETWRAQRPLTDRWTLLAVDRPGHGRSPAARQDFESEANLVAEQLLNEPAHLVGYSYGALVAMFAAVQRTENVLSLTVIEPPATSVALGVPSIDAYATKIRKLIETPDLPPDVALRIFLDVAGADIPLPDPIPQVLLDGIRQLQGGRPPDEAILPLDQLRAAPFPILVVSGGHMFPYEMICDVIVEQVGARRAVSPGMGHLVPDTGDPFNEILEGFLRTAEPSLRTEPVARTS